MDHILEESIIHDNEVFDTAISSYKRIGTIRMISPEEKKQLDAEHDRKQKLDNQIYGTGITSERIFSNIEKAFSISSYRI